MSIIIKSDQLNTLIYKYLQECNLTHTAYTFFNQANLEQSLIQYKFDVKSGQLISMIERALIFNQIQSHITMNDYEQCKEPFYLLKSHVCKITEKVREEKQKIFEELNQNVFAVMRRVNSVHNTLQPNHQYQQIIYEPRTTNFLDRIQLVIGNSDELQLKMSRCGGNSGKYLSAYEPQTQTMTIMSKRENDISITSILPCKNKVKLFQILDQTLLSISPTNQSQLLQFTSTSSTSLSLDFKIPLKSQTIKIKPNKKIKNLICFQSCEQYCVINFNTKKLICRGKGEFQWIDGFWYLVYEAEEGRIRRMSLKGEANSNNMANGEGMQFVCKMGSPVNIQVSQSQIFFSVQSLKNNIINIYNLDQSEPIYIFDFKNTIEIQSTDELDLPQKICQSLWLTANNTDKYVILTDISIKTFDVELNNFSKIVEISDYDIEIKKIARLRKNQGQMYVVGLGLQNLVFYDVSLGKIQRVLLPEDGGEKNIFQLGELDFVEVVLEDKIYILQSGDIQPLFS